MGPKVTPGRGPAPLAADAHRAAEAYRTAIDGYRRALNDGPSPADEAEIRINLADCLFAIGDHEESRQTLIPVVESDLAPVVTARALARVGWAELFLGDGDSCLEKCTQAAKILAPTANHEDLAYVLRWLAYAHRWKGHLVEATRFFYDALASSKRGSDLAQVAYCLNALGIVHRMRGLHADAIAFHQESRDLHEQRGSRIDAAVAQLETALAHLYAGSLTESENALADAERAFAELAYPRGLVDAQLTRCRLLRRREREDEAVLLAEEARKRADSISYKRGVVLALEELGDLAAKSDTRRAARIYQQALSHALEIAPEGDLVYELNWRLAACELEAGNVERADRLSWEAVRFAEKSCDHRETGHALRVLAQVRAAQGDPVEAASLAARAIASFRTANTPFELAQAHEFAASLLLEDGNPANQDAMEHLVTARRIYGDVEARSEARRVDRVLHDQRSRKRRPSSTADDSAPTELLTDDPTLTALVRTAQELGSVDATVLVEGETGTGKELIARIIHESGERATRPFVAVNCAAVAEHLLESELFGHRRGAFTGAEADREGVLASAESGTILLDEIDKASPEFQAKLLRVLEDGSIRPVGSTETLKLKARVVCASNRDLLQLSRTSAFLPDLYYRLCRFRLQIPPLRERRADIPLLLDHFLAECVGQLTDSRVDVSPAALGRLISYDWPGNVRELQNVAGSCAFFARAGGRIEVSHLPEQIREPSRVSVDTLTDEIAELERERIVKALRRAQGVKATAARDLGISRKGLRDRMRRLGLSEDPAEYA